MFRRLSVAVLLMCIGVGCQAQSLTVANSPFSPSNQAAQAGVDIMRPVGALRFTASGGNVDINSIAFTLQGTGAWTTDCSASDGFQLWVDDGDAIFNATDSQVFAAGPTLPTLNAIFSPALSVSPSTPTDIWVVIHILSSAGQSLPTTFSVAVSSASDVSVAGGATVTLGSPAPSSAELSIVLFFVSTFDPLRGGSFGPDITITGSGFTPPVLVTIAGVPCSGTASVNAQNTIITGIKPGQIPSNSNLPITISTGLLGPITLTQTFDASSRGAGTGPDCTTSEDLPFGFQFGFVELAIALVAVHAVRARFAMRSSQSQPESADRPCGQHAGPSGAAGHWPKRGA